MKIQIYRDPVFHIIIDDFLPLEENKKILEHLVSHEKDYVAAALGEGQETNAQYRSNLNLHLDRLYASSEDSTPEEIIGKRGSSPLLAKVDAFIQDERVLSMLDAAPAPLNELRYCNYWSTQVSRYGNKDHYRWHYDRIPWDQTRLITFIYYVHAIPKPFEGGELVLSNGLLWEDSLIGNDSQKSIEPLNNRIVLFDSRCVHTVMPTRAPEAFASGRFSVNVWIGKAEDFE
ncbi:MAG: 2OG-Fe(II) oxygenase [Cytophagaceae bacterium]|jgi:Rps23 Pro-64 3,4-dihydroxylase Tpa1-like proline 4-hydroxylase|nr:2OG-Fe(II) oxygenase [Cytophagaceae bacterium]